MKIEENRLILDTPMSEEDTQEFLVAVKQPQITKIVIEEDDIHAAVIQAIWCAQKEKKVKVKSSFLKPFFENVQHEED